MTPQEQAGARLMSSAYERWADMPPINITIGRIDAYTLIMACQGMLTHPAIPPRMKEALEHLGRQFQEAVCDDPEVYAMTEAGWHREYDVTPEGT